MGIFSPLGLMRVLTNLVDRSLDSADAAAGDDDKRRTPPRQDQYRRPQLKLVGRERNHDTPGSDA